MKKVTALWLFAFIFFNQIFAQTCTGNLLQNPGFENNLSNWEGTGGEIGAAPNVASGTKSLKMCTIGGSIRQTLAATAGKTYKFQYTAKTAGTNQNILFGLKFLSATWQPLTTEWSSYDSPTAFSSNFCSFLSCRSGLSISRSSVAARLLADRSRSHPQLPPWGVQTL